MGLDIIAIDAGDEKKVMTAKLGAGKFVDFSTSKNVVADVKAATEDGLGPHAVILVAVNEKPFQQAAEVCLMPFKDLCLVLTQVVVRETKRNCRRYWPPSWCISPRTSLRVCHQDDHHQGIICW
jgi:hypothetical protein